MIFIERLEMFFVVLPSGISGTIHVDEVSLIFSQPASRLFSSDTIFQVATGWLYYAGWCRNFMFRFQWLLQSWFENSKNPWILKSLKSGMNIARFLGLKKPDGTLLCAKGHGVHNCWIARSSLCQLLDWCGLDEITKSGPERRTREWPVE